MDQQINFTNSLGDKLSGVLSIPLKNFKGLIVIFAHGLGSDKKSEKYQDFKKLLFEKNIGVFLFDFYGHGESEGQFENITIEEGVDDVLSAIKTVRDLGYSKIGLVGTSFGGISSIMAASKTSDLKFLGLLAPVSIPEELSEIRNTEINRLKKPFHLDKNNNGHKVAKDIKIPIYIIHGDKDEIVSLEQSIQFCKLVPNCKLEIIEGGDHQLRSRNYYQKVLSNMTEFILKNSNQT